MNESEAPTITAQGADARSSTAINDHAPEFDAAFIHWWVEDECHPPDLGESTPHDDLVSFKAMLDRHGLRVVRNGS